MDIGIRRAWGQVDTKLPPMEALARHYVMGRPVDKHTWNSDGRLEFIGDMAEQYKVDGVVSQAVRFCTYLGWDKFDLKKQLQERGIPILELDLEYGHPGGAQMRIRAEAFMEMLESRAAAGPCSRRHRNKGKHMAVVGVDLGSQSTKVVILEGDEIVGGASLATGESAETEARMAVQEALKQAGLKREDLKAAVATGTLAVPVSRR